MMSLDEMYQDVLDKKSALLIAGYAKDDPNVQRMDVLLDKLAGEIDFIPELEARIEKLAKGGLGDGHTDA